MSRLLAAAFLPLVLTSGCVNTGASNDPEIPDELVRRSVQAMSLATLVGAELGTAISAPPEGFGACPSSTQDGDSWTFTYGLEGCVPSSGLTEQTMVGLIEVTVAEGSGAFIGSVTEMGVGVSLLSGAITGNTSVAGDLLQADLDLTAGTWMREAASFEFAGFLELTGTAEEVSLFVDGAEMVGTESILRIDVADSVTPREGLRACTVPAAGSMTLARDTSRADLTFSPDSHASGNVTASFSDREPAPVTVCTD